MNVEATTRFLAALRPAFETGDPNAANKATESACVGLVEAQYRTIITGNFAAFLDTLADDIVLENIGPAAIPFVGRWQGRAAVAEAVQKNFGFVEDQRPEVLSVIAQGNTVIVVAREKGRYCSTGQEYETHWVQQFTWCDGRLIHFRQVFDSTALLAALTTSCNADA